MQCLTINVLVRHLQLYSIHGCLTPRTTEHASKVKETDDKFEQVFHYISEHAEVSQKIFFEGQIYDAFSLLAELIAKAKREIVLIDNYVDVGTLNILVKKQENVKVQIYTVKKTKLSSTDINNFNQQYPVLSVDYTEEFHDRFLIIDGILAYHVGASLKDAGKKCFAINRIEDRANIFDILSRIKKIYSGGTDDGRE